MPPSLDSTFLNQHQRHRLSIVLGHLQQARGDQARSDLPRAHTRISRSADQLDLPRGEQSRLRWVRSVLSLSVNDRYEIHRGGLRGYGDVHPSLAAVLDPDLHALPVELNGLLRLLVPVLGGPL